jgi:hypothetical protein
MLTPARGYHEPEHTIQWAYTTEEARAFTHVPAQVYLREGLDLILKRNKLTQLKTESMARVSQLVDVSVSNIYKAGAIKEMSPTLFEEVKVGMMGLDAAFKKAKHLAEGDKK